VKLEAVNRRIDTQHNAMAKRKRTINEL